jgi:hypothetical protein
MPLAPGAGFPGGPMGPGAGIPGGPMGPGAGVPGFPGGPMGPGGGQESGQPPQTQKGTAKHATIQFVLGLSKKDYKEMRKYVYPKATGRLKGFTGTATPSEKDLEYFHALLGRVKILKDEVFKKSGGDVAYYLVNDHGRQIEFRCRKEGSEWLIRSLEVSRASGAIGRPAGGEGRGRRR